jgi:signal peptidase
MARSFGRTAQVVASAAALVATLLLVGVGFGPRTGLYQARTVLSSSMAGTIDPGDIVITRPVPVENVGVGDVVTYRIPVDDHRLVTHRIVEIVRGGPHPVVRTQGDAVAAPDPWAAELSGDTAWLTVGRLPKVGHLLALLQHPVGRTLTSVFCPILLAGLLLRDIWGRRRDARPTPAPARRRFQPQIAGFAVIAMLVLSSPRLTQAAWADATTAAPAFGSATLAAPTAPFTTAGTCSIAIADQVVLHWTPTSSTWAGGYEIRRSTVNGGPYVVVGTASGQSATTYTDGPLPFATTYYYVVAATKGNWRSPDTAQVQRTTRLITCL